MPLNLTTPMTETIQSTEEKSVKDIKLIKVYIRIDIKRIDLVYKKGYDDGEGGIIYSDQEFVQSYPDDEYDAVVGRNGDTYNSLRNACYDELKTSLSIDGTVY